MFLKIMIALLLLLLHYFILIMNNLKTKYLICNKFISNYLPRKRINKESVIRKYYEISSRLLQQQE